ncbi:histone-lysine N-methyltransferase SETMAR [Trichonephila clavipes]|nr:histone-lysine N-methyltransferase SETMAR [Trichonephila clavipes]
MVDCYNSRSIGQKSLRLDSMGSTIGVKISSTYLRASKNNKCRTAGRCASSTCAVVIITETDLSEDDTSPVENPEVGKIQSTLPMMWGQCFWLVSKLQNFRCVQARKKLTDAYGERVLTVHQCQNWFAKFRSGNFDVEDAPRSGRLVEADKDAIKALVDANWRITTREIGLRLNLSNSTVYDYLKGLGLSSKLDVWVPHVLTERHLCRHIDVCDSLLKRHENYPFLKRIITGDEKGHGATKMNRLKPFPKPIFTKKR